VAHYTYSTRQSALRKQTDTRWLHQFIWAKLRSIMQSAPGEHKFAPRAVCFDFKRPGAAVRRREIPGTSPHARSADCYFAQNKGARARRQQREIIVSPAGVHPFPPASAAARNGLGLYDWSNNRLRKTVARIRTRLPYLISRASARTNPRA
jgi:hypothetical protein